jgi:thioredoxin-related protein
MKKILSMAVVLSIWLHADHVHWMGNYDKALHLAKQEHKPLMVLLVEPKCPLCDKVIRDVFMDKPYIERLNQRFVPVIVTYDKHANYPNEMYYSTQMPTLFFVDAQAELFIGKPILGEDIFTKNFDK